MHKLSKSLTILYEACCQLGLKFEIFDPKGKYLAKVSKDDQFFYASTGRMGLYPINPNFASQLANDKSWSSHVLAASGFKVINGDYFFLPSNKDSAMTYADKLGYPVFVKPNQSSQGHLAHKINNADELSLHLDNIQKDQLIAVIQELISQPEYRIFALDGQVQFIYERLAAPGAHTANLSKGGKLVNYQENISPQVAAWTKAVQDRTKLRVCGIDLFATDINDPTTYTIIEVNQNPSLKGIYNNGFEQKAITIWTQILNKYFKGN